MRPLWPECPSNARLTLLPFIDLHFGIPSNDQRIAELAHAVGTVRSDVQLPQFVEARTRANKRLQADSHPLRFGERLNPPLAIQQRVVALSM